MGQFSVAILAAAGSVLSDNQHPHVIRHTTAMHLLQSGVDITVIALWLGHEDTATTHMYVEADLTMKEHALMKLQPAGAAPGRFRASDDLMRFLKAL